ncbi:HAD family phosphatase [Streptomyces sp. PA03-3a]|nr:HAD family phosphatase [Streptomyces sp. PA03-3a]
MTSDRELRALLKGVEGVLFDFDGPICHLFSPERAAPWVTDRLHDFITGKGLPELRPQKKNSPIDVLREAAERWPDSRDVELLEAKLASLETESAPGATQTEGVADLIRAFSYYRVPVAVTTNNSETAVHAHLRARKLQAMFRHHVYGRQVMSEGHALLLKPHPSCINRAVAGLRGPRPDRCLMIGDSSADVRAAREAGVRFLGFVNPHVDDNQGLTEDFPEVPAVLDLRRVRSAWLEVAPEGGVPPVTDGNI